ncbi:unnamed protein product [Rotaria sp. Silwood1]|nr:unnamed protein product [Rotaria sp. Silwood1]
MGNKKSTNNSIPPYAAPPPPPMYDLPNGAVVTSISIETPRLKQRPLGRSRNRLLPKIRAIFIPQARPAGIGVLPMTCAAPVTNPCANLGNRIPIEFLVSEDTEPMDMEDMDTDTDTDIAVITKLQ